MQPRFYAPFRLAELEKTALALATTGAAQTIADGLGGFILVGPDDLPRIRREIVAIQDTRKRSYTRG